MNHRRWPQRTAILQDGVLDPATRKRKPLGRDVKIPTFAHKFAFLLFHVSYIHTYIHTNLYSAKIVEQSEALNTLNMNTVVFMFMATVSYPSTCLFYQRFYLQKRCKSSMWYYQNISCHASVRRTNIWEEHAVMPYTIIWCTKGKLRSYHSCDT